MGAGKKRGEGQSSGPGTDHPEGRAGALRVSARTASETFLLESHSRTLGPGCISQGKRTSSSDV